MKLLISDVLNKHYEAVIFTFDVNFCKLTEPRTGCFTWC